MAEERALEAEVTDSEPTAEPARFRASEIGSDKDFAERARQREVWADLNRRAKEEDSSVSKTTLMRAGFHAGYEAAVDDYMNGKASVEHFEKLNEDREIHDFYAIGFEVGYYRKLAELLVN